MNWKNWEKFYLRDADERALFDRALAKLRRADRHLSVSEFCREQMLAHCKQILSRNCNGNHKPEGEAA